MLIFKKKNTGRPIYDHFHAEFDGNATGKHLFKAWIVLIIIAVGFKYVGEWLGF